MCKRKFFLLLLRDSHSGGRNEKCEKLYPAREAESRFASLSINRCLSDTTNDQNDRMWNLIRARIDAIVKYVD